MGQWLAGDSMPSLEHCREIERLLAIPLHEWTEPVAGAQRGA